MSKTEIRSKAQIIERLETERRRLESNLEGLSRMEMVQPGVVGEWSVKDVLAHLADWLERMPCWVDAARRGEHVQAPDVNLTWKQVDILNACIYKTHRDKPLDEIITYFHDTFNEFMEMVEAMPEGEMLALGLYPFLGKRSIYDWLNNYAAHDLWAKRHIRAWMKNRAEAVH